MSRLGHNAMLEYCGSARATARQRANTITLTDKDVAHKGVHDISWRQILTDLHTKGPA